MGLANAGITRGWTHMGPGLARQVTAEWVCGRFWNQTKLWIWSEPGLLLGYPDPLLTLHSSR